MVRRCKLCGAPLNSNRKKFCNKKHANKYYYLQNKDKHRDYMREYMRQYNDTKRPIRYCLVCGKIVPKGRYKYCSHSCYLKKYKKDNHNIVGVMENYYPLKCEECGGELIFDDKDVYCSKCGLVQE